MTRRTVTVDAETLEAAAKLVGRPVWNSLNLGLSIDDLDVEGIREAHILLQVMLRQIHEKETQ